jgi:hypothetical protein
MRMTWGGVLFGPAGGTGGNNFDDSRILGPHNRISKIKIRSGDWIDSIQTAWTDWKVIEIWGIQHGGTGGTESIFSLAPDEYVIGIEGKYHVYINSLQIITNKRKSPLYGGTEGIQFYSFNGGVRDTKLEVRGFFGSSGAFLNAIGVRCSE